MHDMLTDQRQDQVTEPHSRLSSTDQLTPVAARPAESQPPALELFHVSKTFGRHQQAVCDLSLVIQQGEIFGLLGPNGSGKTTLINLITGLGRPTDGAVRLLGIDVQRHAQQVHQVVGTVPQETALYEELSALQNMQYHAALYGVPRAERATRIQAMLALVHLQDRQHTRVRTFSGGMKRRLALARALLHQPRLLILDEPTLGVDVQNRHALYAFIRALPAQGVTVLLTTNDLHEAEALCTRIAILDQGHLRVVETPQHLRQQEGGRQMAVELTPIADPELLLYALRSLPGMVSAVQQDATHLLLQSTASDALPPVLAVIQGHGCQVRHLALPEEHLEDTFLRITGSLLRD